MVANRDIDATKHILKFKEPNSLELNKEGQGLQENDFVVLPPFHKHSQVSPCNLVEYLGSSD